MSEKITITFSRYEALVLWNMLADLENALPEPLADDYDQQLLKARESVRDQTS